MSASDGASGMAIEPGELPFDCSDSFIATVIPPCSRRNSPATQYIAGIGERRRRDNRRRFPNHFGGTVTGNVHATERKSAKGILRHQSGNDIETALDVLEALPGGDRAATDYHFRSPRAYHRFASLSLDLACPEFDRCLALNCTRPILRATYATWHRQFYPIRLGTVVPAMTRPFGL
jgi:hypothetical protein